MSFQKRQHTYALKAEVVAGEGHLYDIQFTEAVPRLGIKQGEIVSNVQSSLFRAEFIVGTMSSSHERMSAILAQTASSAQPFPSSKPYTFDLLRKHTVQSFLLEDSAAPMHLLDDTVVQKQSTSDLFDEMLQFN